MAHPAPLPPARRRRARRGRCVRRGPLPQPAVAGGPADRDRARRPVGRRPPRVAAARGWWTSRSRSRGAAPWPRTSAAARTGEQAELRRDRRYSVVRRLAGLYAGYGVQRPAHAQRLARRPRHRRHRARAERRPPWQAELWRRVVPVVDAPPPDERHRQVVAMVRGGDALAAAGRLSMFGHTRMAATELELLRAVGAVREVHLWLPQPSPAAWRRLPEAVAEGPVRRADDLTGRLVHHPLLSSLGRDSRELQRSLALLGPVEVHEVPGAPPRPGATLLGRLQHDLRDDVAPTTPAPLTRTADGRARATGRWRPRTGRCRCTPATAPPARSRCCARCSSACSRTTPRSSRGTCW